MIFLESRVELVENREFLRDIIDNEMLVEPELRIDFKRGQAMMCSGHSFLYEIQIQALGPC